MKNDEGRLMKDDDFKLLRGFADRQTDEQTDICECRVAFATEKDVPLPIVEKSEPEHLITQKESTVKTGNGDQPITRRK